MSSILLLPALGLAWLTGLLLVRAFWAGRGGAEGRLTNLWLPLALGLGVTSLGFFVWLHVRDVFPCHPVTMDLVLLVLAGGLRLTLKDRESGPVGSGPDSSTEPRHAKTVFFTVAVCAAGCFLAVYLNGPYGWCDSWMIWNARARFLFLGADGWRDAFVPFIRHAEYPLLVPASVARAWHYAGAATTFAPMAVGLTFTVAVVGTVSDGLALLKGRREAYLAGTLLLATWVLVFWGAAQYSDVPLAFFVAATLVLLSAGRRGEGRPGILVLAGVSAGLAAWTKNEGMLFVLALALAWAFASVVWKVERRPLREPAAFLAGLAPVLALVFYYKFGVAPADPMVVWQEGGGATVERITDLSRHGYVAVSYLKALALFGRGAYLALAVFLFLSGTNAAAREGTSYRIVLLTILAMAAGYFLVYVITPNLEWHVTNSIARLFLHFWPASVFGVFLIVKPRPAYSTSTARTGAASPPSMRSGNAASV